VNKINGKNPKGSLPIETVEVVEQLSVHQKQTSDEKSG
jgi:hypothetical protein